MTKKSGFTLIEIIIATIILGILTTVAVNSYNSYIQQSYANNAINNLKQIAMAQKVYYLNHGQYYLKDKSVLSDINNNLGLNIIDNNYDYHCWTQVGYDYNAPYICEARSNSVDSADNYTPGSSAFFNSFTYENNTPEVPIYGIGAKFPQPTMSCGTIYHLGGYAGGGSCSQTVNSCPAGTVNLGTTFDCPTCCPCPAGGCH